MQPSSSTPDLKKVYIHTALPIFLPSCSCASSFFCSCVHVFLILLFLLSLCVFSIFSLAYLQRYILLLQGEGVKQRLEESPCRKQYTSLCASITLQLRKTCRRSNTPKNTSMTSMSIGMSLCLCALHIEREERWICEMCNAVFFSFSFLLKSTSVRYRFVSLVEAVFCLCFE